MKDCPECKGNGVVMVAMGDRPDHFGNWDAEEVDCRECDGTGKVE